MRDAPRTYAAPNRMKPEHGVARSIRSGARPSVAICICTCDRPDVIARALESVLGQSVRPDELIVVDQSRGGETERIVADIKAREPWISYLHVAERGLSRAYNTATANTNSDLLAFTDDDCVAPAGWLEQIVQCFDAEPDTGLLYGQVLIPAELKGSENVDGITPALPIHRRRRMSLRDGYEVFGMGANFAARRSLLTDLGGFDVVLGGGGPLQSSQDFDLSYRAFRRGHTVLLAPEVVVYHYGFRAHSDWPKVVSSYGIGMGGFYAKHVRLGDLYAMRLLGAKLMREGLRALKKSVGGHGQVIDWTLFGYTLIGLKRSFQFSIDRDAMLYRVRDPQ
jgi:GT2 family glycosyltransferase